MAASRSAAKRYSPTPSAVFSAMLPTKPSHTATSHAPVNSSLLSMLPVKCDRRRLEQRVRLLDQL